MTTENIQKIKDAAYLAGEFATGFFCILGFPFAMFWLKYIFCG